MNFFKYPHSGLGEDDKPFDPVVKTSGIIGPLSIGIVDRNDSLKRAVSQMYIPDRDLPSVTADCLTRCVQQNFMNDDLVRVIDFAADDRNKTLLHILQTVREEAIETGQQDIVSLPRVVLDMVCGVTKMPQD